MYTAPGFQVSDFDKHFGRLKAYTKLEIVENNFANCAKVIANILFLVMGFDVYCSLLPDV